ncbi:MAG TPA: histidine kinase [Methylibium sp.]|nr:histidine kinase [Methylibium sp.]
MPPVPPRPPAPGWWAGSSAALVRAFHGYATWLVGLSWWRFILMAVLLLICSGILSNLPPFSWTLGERTVVEQPERKVVAPKPPIPPAAPGEKRSEPLIKIEKSDPGGSKDGDIDISIGKEGIRIKRGAGTPADVAASAAAEAAAAASAAASAAGQARDAGRNIEIKLPPGAVSEAVKSAVEEARREIEAAVEEAARDAEQARRDAEEAMHDAEQAAADLRSAGAPRVRTQTVTLGDYLPQLAMLWIVMSIIVKITYKGRLQAEAQAAQATEVAEDESLKRQVLEARMAAMQAQVEPHFLFNTLASIDHLIETDPPRASQMQKHLIALLRASMPTLREASDGGTRDLGRELTVIRPYLEILKVRMEERLVTEIDVPEGLLSAEFPPMMIQTLVENAIKHGLEPKPDGGRLKVKAEIVHGKLAVTVADTGLGFGKAATAGTGVGLANIRERLHLLYGGKATLTVAENQPGGTVVTVTVPYRHRVAVEAAA